MKTNLEKVAEQMEAAGIEGVKDVDPYPERTAYINCRDQDTSDLDADDYKKWCKKLKALKEEYIVVFYRHFADVYPHMLFELDEDKVYWNYNEDTGIYNEINFTVVRGLVVKLLTEESLLDKATEPIVKTILARYRGNCPEKGKHYNDFDARVDTFHAKNGWVNVHNLKFQNHTPDLLSLRVSSAEYNVEAKCPIYDKFLNEDIQIQDDAVRVIDQFSGLILTPDIRYQKMLTLIGRPASGKSTLLNAWNYILGDMSTQKKLTEISGESARFIGSSLVGRTLCWFDEVDVKRSEMSNNLGVMITGEHINVERKGINGFVEALNNLKCVLTANRLPLSSEDGMFRRLILINLNRSFHEEGIMNKNILEELKDEASGILNRMLKGLKDLNDSKGFTMIAGHDELIEEYKQASDPIAGFLHEFFEPHKVEEIPAAHLLNAYKDYRDGDSFVRGLTPQKFGLLVRSQSSLAFSKMEVKKYKGGNRWVGLRLKNEYKFTEAMTIRTDEQVKIENDW